MRVGRTVENTLKRCGMEQKRGGTKILKRGGQAVSRDGWCLKKGATGTPDGLWTIHCRMLKISFLQNLAVCYVPIIFRIIQLQKYVVSSILSGYSMCNLMN